MNKQLSIIMILVSIIIVLSGCIKPQYYSDKFHGIPLYPGVKLISSSEYKENYEIPKFQGTFKEVNEFYIQHINEEIWSIEKNPLYDNQENRIVGTEGYILKDGEKEVSLIIERIKTKDKKGPLYIRINGSPLEEGKFIAKGQNKHWEIFLEYIIRKDTILINGDATYTGDNPPNKVNYDFLEYKIIVQPRPTEGFTGESNIVETRGEPVEGSKVRISGQSSRRHELEIYKEAIDNAYIEIRWEDQGEIKIEKVAISVIH